MSLTIIHINKVVLKKHFMRRGLPGPNGNGGVLEHTHFISTKLFSRCTFTAERYISAKMKKKSLSSWNIALYDQLLTSCKYVWDLPTLCVKEEWGLGKK